MAQAERAVDGVSPPNAVGPVSPSGDVAVAGSSSSSSDDLASIGVKTSATPIPELGPSGAIAGGGSVTGLTPVGGAGAGSSGRCPENMVEVEGDYCPYIEQKCLRWLDPETKMRCAEFAPSGKCQSKTTKKHFCIDRYEWPNKVGEKPVVMGTWYQAKDACTAVVNASAATVSGHSRAKVKSASVSVWVRAQLGRVQHRQAAPRGKRSGARQPCDARCRSRALGSARRVRLSRVVRQPLRRVRHERATSTNGVVNESGAPYKSGLKGGYWGPVRTRCRPMTVAHSEIFSFYQIGFRCCEDVPTDKGVAGTKGSPNGAGAPVSHGARHGSFSRGQRGSQRRGLVARSVAGS